MKKITSALLAGAMILGLGSVTLAKPKKIKRFNVTKEQRVKMNAVNEVVDNKLTLDISVEDTVAINRLNETVVSYKGGQTVRVVSNDFIMDRVFMDKEVARKYANIVSYHRGKIWPVGMYFPSEDGSIHPNKQKLMDEAEAKWGINRPTTTEYMLPIYLMNNEAIKAYEFVEGWVESYEAR